MGNKTVFYTFESDHPLPKVREAVQKSLILLGGMVMDQGDGFEVRQAINGVNFAFAANFSAYVNIKHSAPNKYELLCNINWSPNGVFWVCLIAGLFLFVPWIVNLFYLFIDPTQVYQQALFRAQSFLSS